MLDSAIIVTMTAYAVVMVASAIIVFLTWPGYRESQNWLHERGRIFDFDDWPPVEDHWGEEHAVEQE